MAGLVEAALGGRGVGGRGGDCARCAGGLRGAPAWARDHWLSLGGVRRGVGEVPPQRRGAPACLRSPCGPQQTALCRERGERNRIGPAPGEELVRKVAVAVQGGDARQEHSGPEGKSELTEGTGGDGVAGAHMQHGGWQHLCRCGCARPLGLYEGAWGPFGGRMNEN